MRILVALLFLATAFAGCSSDDGPAYETPPQLGTGEYVITIVSTTEFSPAYAKVPKGAIVVFTAEAGGCNLKSQEPGGPDSKKNGQTTVQNEVMSKGDERRWLAPDTASTFNVGCTSAKTGLLLKVG